MSSQAVVKVHPDGSLALDCGHVVRRVKRYSKNVICEHCQPERFAKLSANGKKQWPTFRASDPRGGRSASALGEAPLAREDSR